MLSPLVTTGPSDVTTQYPVLDQFEIGQLVVDVTTKVIITKIKKILICLQTSLEIMVLNGIVTIGLVLRTASN